MTDAVESTRLFFESLASATKEVVSQIAGSEATVEMGPATPVDSALDVLFLAEGSLVGNLAIRFSAADVAVASSILTGEESNKAAALTEGLREAAIELCRQICGTFASALRARFGPLELRNDDSAATILSELSAETQLNIRIGDRTFSLRILLTRALSESLKRKQAPPRQVCESGDATGCSRQREPADPTLAIERPAHNLHSSNLAILLDLELPVTLRFGSREMLLKEVMELTTGSVVELDRRVHEPVDMLIDNKLIARGEVVLVEGNYGVRVLEVANERERLECLP